jgi:Uma2 family endonuclease
MIVEAHQDLLAQRRQLGQDRWDEVWDGVLHMVPPPSGAHQRLGAELVAVMLPLGREQGLLCSLDTGQFDPARGWEDYRQPDVALYEPAHASDRGIDGRAEVVVEIRSPRDATYEKLPFYARLGVPELLVIHPSTRMVERFTLRDGALRPDPAGGDGSVSLQAIPLTLRPVEGPDGPALQLTWPGGERLV